MVRVRRLVHTTWLRLVDLLDHARWVVLSLVLACVGLLGVWTEVPRVVNIGLALTSFGLLWGEWQRHLQSVRSLTFIDRVGDGYDDLAATYRGSTRYSLVKANQHHVVLDRVASAAIAADGVTGTVASERYVLPHELRAGVQYRRMRIKRRDTYNGPLLGLDSDLGSAEVLATDRWKLLPARYWDHLASDIMASKIALRSGRVVPQLGRSLYVDRAGRLRDLGESWLLNGIGTSLLAITSDRRVVVVSQSELNESSGGLLAPSGSGSLEPRDLHGASSAGLAAIVANGALRELSEETGIVASEVVETAFLGFGRWVEKAGKPELWSVAWLAIDSHQVRRKRILNQERPFTTSVEALRVSDPVSWDADRPEEVLREAESLLLSVPLLIGLRLLVEAYQDPDSVAGDLVRRAMATAP
ncbi:hypothetical protein [Nocardioides sp. W7]|uniref:hypothetical protein n=1 Tax=Nocardioides sp. W7 TaxID=2931390 RepID=UPI001FD5B6E5|nr:hypothetical protein [Nocardioides sp. W7]